MGDRFIVFSDQKFVLDHYNAMCHLDIAILMDKKLRIDHMSGQPGVVMTGEFPKRE